MQTLKQDIQLILGLLSLPSTWAKKCQINRNLSTRENGGKTFACHSCAIIQEHPQHCHCCYSDIANSIHVKPCAPKFHSPYSSINPISVKLSAISINLPRNPTRFENFSPFYSFTGKIQCEYAAVSVYGFTRWGISLDFAEPWCWFSQTGGIRNYASQSTKGQQSHATSSGLVPPEKQLSSSTVLHYNYLCVSLVKNSCST